MGSKTRSSFDFKRTALSVAVVTAMAAGYAQAAPRTWGSSTVFSINNVVGDYSGKTVGTVGNGSDPSILCGAPIAGSPACPTGEIAPGITHPQPIAASVADPTGVNILLFRSQPCCGIQVPAGTVVVAGSAGASHCGTTPRPRATATADAKASS